MTCKLFNQASWLCLLVLLTPGHTHGRVFVSEAVNIAPSPESFSICYGHSCKTVQQISITDSDWSAVSVIFKPSAQSPAEERVQIARAIAKLEQLIGPITGTANDKGYNLDGLLADGNQMDCIDESTNTTTYLTMLEKSRLLKWHTVEDPVTRGFFIFGWPHTTAVIQASNSKQYWAVDSWFYDNGEEPAIVPLEKWKDGWDPYKQ